MITQLNDMAEIWWQWMGSMFWQVSLFIIIITLLDMAIRRWAWPQVRYVLWGLVFLKLIIPPTWQMPTSILSWIQPKVEEQISIQIAPFEVTADYQGISVPGLPSTTQISESAVKKEKASWQAIVLLTWLGGMITFGLMLVVKMSRLPKRSKKQEVRNSPEWFQELLERTARTLNLRKIPDVVFSRDMKSPAVYGIFHPVLLLPEGCLEQLTKEQAEHVLIHELCHLKRGDLLVHWFCLALQVVYWFNPLLIWTRRQMRHVCEICCDLSVANLLREKTTAYRNTLLATARELLTENLDPGLGLLGVFEEPFRLVTRLRWLEKKTWGNRKLKIAVTIVTSLIMVVCVMPMAGLSQQTGSNNQDYKFGIEYDQENGPVTITYPAVFYEAFFVEVDEDKDLDLDAAEYFGGFNDEQIEDAHTTQSVSSDISVDAGPYYSMRAAINPGLSSKQEEDGTKASLKANYFDVTIPEKDDNNGSPVSIISGHNPYPDSSSDPSIDYSNWSPMDMLRCFKDAIKIGARSFPNIETALKTIENRSVSMRNILAPANKTATIKIPASTGDHEHILKIAAQVLENGRVSQEIDLTAYKSPEWPGASFGINTNGIEIKDGSTLVMTCPVFKHAVAEGDTPDRTNLYIFLTSRVFNTAKNAQDYFQLNNMELSPDVFYTDLISADYISPTSNRTNPEYRIGVEYDDAAEVAQPEAQNKVLTTTINRAAMVRIDSDYSLFLQELNLPPENLERLKKFMLDEEEASVKATMAGNIAIAESVDPGDEYRRKIKELLGDEDYEKYQAFKERIWEVRGVTDFIKSISSGDMLTENQQRALINAMYNNRQKIVSEQNNEQAGDVLITDEFARNLNQMERMHEGYLDAAKGLLTEIQMEKLKAYYKKQYDEQESNMRVMSQRIIK